MNKVPMLNKVRAIGRLGKWKFNRGYQNQIQPKKLINNKHNQVSCRVRRELEEQWFELYVTSSRNNSRGQITLNQNGALQNP